MTDGSAGGSDRRHSWRIGRLVCGVAAVMAVVSGVAGLASAQPPRPPNNPPLTAGCGLDVALVLDESLSINATMGATAATQSAARSFVSALNNTGSRLMLTSFSILARRGPFTNFTPVTTDTASQFNSWIGTGGNPGALTNGSPGFNPAGGGAIGSTAGTNWQQGLLSTQATGVNPPLMVFVTDGDPNRYNNPAQGSGTFDPAALTSAVTAANMLKVQQGTHIFVIGVGPVASGAGAAASEGRIQAISGGNKFPVPHANFTTADYTLVSDFSDLEQQMRAIVTEICGGTLTITKHVLDHAGLPVENASGFRFETTLSSGGHTWVEPARADNGTTDGPTATKTTGADGIARFEWTLDAGVANVQASVRRFERNGFSFVVAQCTTTRPDGSTTTETSTDGIPSATLGKDDIRTCTVTNRQHAADLTVVKHLEPTDDAGKFDLLINGMVRSPEGGVSNLGTTGPITLPLGTHTVSETAVAPTSLADYSSSIQCVDLNDNNRVVAEGPGTSLTLDLTSQDENIVCTITNVSTKFGDLTVIKHLIPDSDSGRFNLLVSGTTTGEKTNAGDGDRLSLAHIPFGPYDVTESAVAPTNLANYNITTVCTDGDGGGAVAENTSGPNVSFELNRTDNNVVCVIQNTRATVPVAHLTVVKNVVPSGDAGAFDLLIGGDVWAPAVGDGGSTGRLAFELGKYIVTERGADGTDLADFSISTTCVDKAHGGRTVAKNAQGPSVSVRLRRESADIVCTITNTRTEPPGGGGEIPDTPGPYLGVVKDMPAVARVGQEVTFTIHVRNLGHGTAKGVQLHETPPHGMRLVSVADHGTIQHGTGVWHLGNLAPGASRTVHGTVRVTETGVHVNTAVATATNADAALSDAALLARGAAHPPPPPSPPPVTG